MSTLANGARIGLSDVKAEIKRLLASWQTSEVINDRSEHPQGDRLVTGDTAQMLEFGLAEIDEFDRCQLEHVMTVCRSSASLAEAGRALFAVSRLKRGSLNDSDRLKKYLARFGLDWEGITKQALQ